MKPGTCPECGYGFGGHHQNCPERPDLDDDDNDPTEPDAPEGDGEEGDP